MADISRMDFVTENTGVVVVDKIDKNIITRADREYFTEVKIGGSPLIEGNIIYLTYTDKEYYIKWIKRVDGKVLSGKMFERAIISLEIGDLEDRISDSFKFNALLLLLIKDMYVALPSTVKDKFSKQFNNLVQTYSTFRSNNQYLFNIDLKGDYVSEFSKILNREKNVTAIIKEYSDVSDEPI